MPFITVKESIFDVEDVAVDLTISGTKLAPPAGTVIPKNSGLTLGKEKKLTDPEESYKQIA